MTEPALSYTVDSVLAGAEVGASIVSLEGDSVVLTYDDGPEPGGTDGVLAALAERDATATFFLLLCRTGRYPGLVNEILSAGHEIGLHGVDHRALTDVDPNTVGAHVADAKHRLEDQIGQPVRWFRPTFGSQSPATWHAAVAAGMTPVMWNADCLDWEEMPDHERVGLIRAWGGAGTLVMMHDGLATSPEDGVDDDLPPPRIDRGQVTRDVLDTFAAKGMPCRSLGQALRTGRPVIRVWFEAPTA